MAHTSEIDALFQLPPDQFTAARNALAARLKSGGKAEEAARVKALPKPPLSAWAVNQLYWRHRKPFDRLMTSGDELRKVQASQLKGKGGDLREPLEARRAALTELVKEATALLRAAGHSPSPDLMRRITTTLEALATYGSHPSAPAAGRLTDDVDAPGFEALAALIPRGGGGARGSKPRVIPFVPPGKRKPAHEKLDPKERRKREQTDRKARLAAATAAVQASERALAGARAAAARAEAALKKAAARAKEAEREKEATEARYEKAAADAERARQEARKVASEAEEAAQALEDAERAVEEAKRTKANLSAGG